VSLSAVDCIQPALQHARQQLFAKFRFSQWSRLALVGILAGELHVGGCNFGNFGQSWRIPRNEFLAPASPFGHIDPARIAQFAGLIIALVLLGTVAFFVFLYINSVFRFILFETVLRRECSIGDGWQRWHRAGRRYFLWQLVLLFSTGIFLGLALGVPLMMMGASGVFRNPSGHMAGLAGGVLLLIAIAVVFVLMVAAVQVLARDFLVPLMALEELDFADGWSRLLGMIRLEPGKYFVYLLLKLALAIAAAFLFGIACIIPLLVVIIPAAIFVVAGAAAGLTWSATTVSLAIIFGSIAVAILLYLVALVCVPATVFFPAYAMYFLAARYSSLNALLNPAPAPPAPAAPPVVEAPPLPPSPEPIG